MKHLFRLWLMLSLIMVPLGGCSLPMPSNLVNEIKTTLETSLPPYINQSFQLPSLPGYQVQWTSQSSTIQGSQLVYESPMQSTTIDLVATVTNAQYQQSFTFQLPLIANDSGQLTGTLRLQLPVALTAIQKEVYTAASLNLSSEVNGQTTVFESPMKIRGRGNSSFYIFEKKPYRLHFDKNTRLMGMRPSNDYVLLPENSDKSFIRNWLTQKLTRYLTHLPYTPEMRFVHVYINDEYRGLYVLTEQVEVESTKYDIPTNLSQDDAGFFLELDFRAPEERAQTFGIEWFYVNTVPYVIHSPKIEDPLFTRSHYNFIRDYLRNLDQALTAQKGYENYIDVANFIDYFLAQEIAKNVDVGWSSVFMAKPIGQPLVLGPLWDFDLAYGNADYIDYGPTGFWGFVNYKNRWFHLLMQIPEVRQQFVDRFNEVYVALKSEWISLILNVGRNLLDDAERNYNRWPTLSYYQWPNPSEMVAADTYEKQLIYLDNYLVQRLDWLHEMLNRPSFMTNR